MITTSMPDQVLENSIAEVSLLVGLITLARSTLTNWVKPAIELLRPVVENQLKHILQSKALAMDETPIKAGIKYKGRLQQVYFWPIYGEENEMVFTYSNSRGRTHRNGNHPAVPGNVANR